MRRGRGEAVGCDTWPRLCGASRCMVHTALDTVGTGLKVEAGKGDR